MTDSEFIDFLSKHEGAVTLDKQSYMKLETLNPPYLDIDTGVIRFEYKGIPIFWENRG